LITLHQDVDAILFQTFEVTPFKRNYDAAFGQIAAFFKKKWYSSYNYEYRK